MSPLEKAILGISRTGWLMSGLGRSPFDNVSTWSVDLVPGHLGAYRWGKKEKSGMWSVYPNAQARITGCGATALAAIQDALAKLDRSDAKVVYEDLERAFEEVAKAFEDMANERKSRT